MLVHRVNKLRATYSSISPGLINKGHSIYISVPWFRFTLMDLSFRVPFQEFQIIFDRINDWPFLSQLELNQQMQSNTAKELQLFQAIVLMNIQNKQAPREPKRTFK